MTVYRVKASPISHTHYACATNADRELRSHALTAVCNALLTIPDCLLSCITINVKNSVQFNFHQKQFSKGCQKWFLRPKQNAKRLPSENFQETGVMLSCFT